MRWRKITGWSLAALAILLLATIVGGLLFLQTASFQRLAIRTAVDDLNQATGGHASVGGFDFHLSTLTATLYNITVHGTEPAVAPPLLHIDRLSVAFKIESILQRKFTLAELLIEHPVAHVQVHVHGKSNLPQGPSGQNTGSGGSVFDLAVGHLLLSNGQVQYNDRTIPLDAELHYLKTDIHFEPIGTRYAGSLSYSNGSLRYAGDPVLSHGLEAKFSVSPRQFSLHSATLTVGSSAVSLNAELSNYANPTVDGNFDIRLHAQDFSALSSPVTPAGDLSSSGTLHYQQNGSQPLLQCISVHGQVASSELSAAAPQGRIDLQRLQGHYQLANGTLQSHDMSFETLDGKISTDILLEHFDHRGSGQIRASVQRISLPALQRSIRLAAPKNVELAGRLNGTLDASWKESPKNLIAHADLLLNSGASRGREPASTKLPVDGAIHAFYDARASLVDFRDTSVRIPSATVTVRGQVSSHSNLFVEATGTDLHQLAEMLSAFGSKQATSLDLAGSASLRGRMAGAMSKPQISGDFNAQNLRVQGSEWRVARADFEAGPSGITIRNALLVSARQGRASLDGTIGLRNWSYLPSNPVAAELSVQNMSVADLQQLANMHYPVSGDLSADLSLHGSQVAPQGKGSARVENAQAYNERIQNLSADFTANKDSISSTLSVRLPAGAATGTISFTPQTKAYKVQLNAPAIVLQKLQTVQAKKMGLGGTVSLIASGEGTIDRPQLEASFQIPQLQLRDKVVSQISAQLHVSNQHAQFNLDSQIAQATFRSHANVTLTGDYYAEATLDTSGIPLAPLFAVFSSNTPQGFSGETELHVTMKGPLKDRTKIEVHVTIPVLKASYRSLEIGAASPIRADYARSVITLQPAEIRGTGTALKVQGAFPIGGVIAPSLAAQGSIDVRLLEIFNPDIQSSGTVSLDMHASGTAEKPTVRGQLRLQDVALNSPSAPLGVQNLSGNLQIEDNTLQLSGLTADVGGGRVSAGGSIAYRPDLQFNVTLQSNGVRLRYPDGVRALLDGNLVLSGTKEASTLNGRVLIDSLSFTPDFDLAKFSDQFGGAAIPSAPGALDNVKLAIAVQSKSNLSANSSQISIEGDVNLQLVGTAANPVIVGRTDLSSGELFYRNVRYQLQRGIITFDNPNQTMPTLNVSITTTIEQYNLTLSLRGPFDRLTTSYTSEPPLATADVINLIANGQTASQGSAAGTSTDSILASQVAGQLSGGLQHLAGISALQIDPLLGGNNQNPSARVAIQQRVTKNFLFTFSTDLSQPGTEVVQGDYRINKSWSVSVTRDELGGVSVDGKYHRKF